MRVTLAVSATYPADAIKPDILSAMCAAIEQHLKAYGFQEIVIVPDPGEKP